MLLPHTPEDRQDLATFLGRALRLSPDAYVRIRTHHADVRRVVVWVVVLGVVARRDFGARLDGVQDITVSAHALNVAVAQSVTREQGATLPRPRDDEWRASLPPATGWEHREDLPAGSLREAVDTSAASLKDADATMMAAAGEAMLSLTVISLTDDTGARERLDLPLRLVLAATRMGYLPDVDQDADIVRIATRGPWTVLATPAGAVFRRAAKLDVFGLS